MPAFSSCRAAFEYLDVPYLGVLASRQHHLKLHLWAYYRLQKVAACRHDVEESDTLLAYVLIET